MVVVVACLPLLMKVTGIVASVVVTCKLACVSPNCIPTISDKLCGPVRLRL